MKLNWLAEREHLAVIPSIFSGLHASRLLCDCSAVDTVGLPRSLAGLGFLILKLCNASMASYTDLPLLGVTRSSAGIEPSETGQSPVYSNNTAQTNPTK